MLKATSTRDRDTAPETKTKTRRFKEESEPDGQHSPSTFTFSRVTLEHAWRDKSTTHAYFQWWWSASLAWRSLVLTPVCFLFYTDNIGNNYNTDQESNGISHCYSGAMWRSPINSFYQMGEGPFRKKNIDTYCFVFWNALAVNKSQASSPRIETYK